MKKIPLILIAIFLPSLAYAGSTTLEILRAQGYRSMQQDRVNSEIYKSEQERKKALKESRRYLSLEDAIRTGSDVWGYIDSDPKRVSATLDEMNKSEDERKSASKDSRRYLTLEDAIKTGSDVWGYIDSDPQSVSASLDQMKK